jgi:hypothetical protein
MASAPEARPFLSPSTKVLGLHYVLDADLLEGELCTLWGIGSRIGPSSFIEGVKVEDPLPGSVNHLLQLPRRIFLEPEGLSYGFVHQAPYYKPIRRAKNDTRRNPTQSFDGRGSRKGFGKSRVWITRPSLPRRRPRLRPKAFPSISSDCPPEYWSAVSKGLIPASSARVVTISGGRPVTALVLDVSEGMIQTIRLVANPEKLDGVRAVEAP